MPPSEALMKKWFEKAEDLHAAGGRSLQVPSHTLTRNLIDSHNDMARKHSNTHATNLHVRTRNL